ncbi:hypothetical protein J0X14_14340 [Muricauda sp. CAU 1633]|uniref:hypothetical protein n=1 Tax=Allomuricauda sp. CAU 1633 TaxID=2816036 RepID=UPI001A8E5FC5|nr:hypothetical protein [Muricauda sp. CAU 1633]MBO0323484.1 hypothetical protein [Muricauda sp. CAU 1633]
MGTKNEFFRVDYNKGKDVDGDDCVVPTVWFGNQGFNLTAQYKQGGQSAQEHAEWYASMFKKAIDGFASQQTTSQEQTIERLRDFVSEVKFHLLSEQFSEEGLSEKEKKLFTQAKQLLNTTEPIDQ